MKIDYTNLSFTQLIDKIEKTRFFDLPRMTREAFRRLLTRVEALETSTEPKYKVYTALLTQSGTDAPVATVLENTLGDIVWSRSDLGVYVGTLSEAFTENKTKLEIGLVSDGDYSARFFGNFYISNEDTIGIRVFAGDPATEGDSLLNNTPIEIRVYN